MEQKGKGVQENWQSEAFSSSQTESLCFLPPLPELAKGSIHQDLCKLQPLAFHKYRPETHRLYTPGTGQWSVWSSDQQCPQHL